MEIWEPKPPGTLWGTPGLLPLPYLLHRVGYMEGGTFVGAFKGKKLLFRGIFMRISRDMQKSPVNGYLSP